jgi:hypothetical protein
VVDNKVISVYIRTNEKHVNSTVATICIYIYRDTKLLTNWIVVNDNLILNKSGESEFYSVLLGFDIKFWCK